MKRLKIIFTAVTVCLILGLAGCSMSKMPTKDELLANVPTIDLSSCNKFKFTMSVTAHNAEGDSGEFQMTGALDIWKTISHMYDLDMDATYSNYGNTTETWADFESGTRYVNQNQGWSMESISRKTVLDELVNTVNDRDRETMTLNQDDSACTLSWTFQADNDYLFGDILSHYTEGKNLDGSGRITAVFDPKTYEFRYFNFVISASNDERAGAMLDAIFYWDVKNSETEILEIPKEISSTTYKTETGVLTDGGYDDRVNPLAESFMKAYRGTTELTHYKDGASMFWTLAEDDRSATVNYIRTDSPETFYENDYSFLTSFFGEPVEKTDNDAYFYDASSGELTLITKGSDWYAELVITGTSDTTQGKLRKSLITYKSKLEI